MVPIGSLWDGDERMTLKPVSKLQEFIATIKLRDQLRTSNKLRDWNCNLPWTIIFPIHWIAISYLINQVHSAIVYGLIDLNAFRSHLSEKKHKEGKIRNTNKGHLPSSGANNNENYGNAHTIESASWITKLCTAAPCGCQKYIIILQANVGDNKVWIRKIRGSQKKYRTDEGNTWYKENPTNLATKDTKKKLLQSWQVLK